MRRILFPVILFFVALIVPGAPVRAQTPPTGIEKINHVVIIFMENWTFDGLYSKFPGANGLQDPSSHIVQVDRDGKPYETLPPVINAWENNTPDTRFPADLPNAPFIIDDYVPNNQIVPSPLHRFYEYQLQMNGGKMDKYVAWSDSGAMTMGVHDTFKLPLYPYAKEYTLADNYFSSAFGGSMLNHFWLVCACTPRWENPPAEFITDPMYDAQGKLITPGEDYVNGGGKGNVTPDGYLINDVDPRYNPHHADVPLDLLAPPQDALTIGDRLSEKGLTWAWYGEGYNDALAGHPNSLYIFEHQPFVYFRQFGDGTEAKKQHLKDTTDFMDSLKDGTLPNVSYIKPIGTYDEHQGYSNVYDSEMHAIEWIKAVMESPYWNETAIFLTYDDYGGTYDHVPPPTVDRWGYGGRVPLLVISPHAKKGFVDHTLYDHTSTLKFIETRWGLEALSERDANANDLTNAFDFGQDTLPATGADLYAAFGWLAVLGVILTASGLVFMNRKSNKGDLF
jgi:phospholipase C